MSTDSGNNLLGPIVPDDTNIQPDDLAYVKSEEFLNVCQELVSSRQAAASPSESNSDDIRSNAGVSDTSATTIEVDPHEPSRVEQHLYYAGIRGSKGSGPKLVWRDSPDRFDEPSGPREERRLMRVLPVQDEHVLGELVSNGVNRWDFVRKDIVAMLEAEGVSFSSVDFVRFTWLNKKPDEAPESDGEEESGDGSEGESEEKEEGKVEEEKDDEVIDVDDYDKIPLITRIEDGDRVFTDPTVWVGVSPDTLTATGAFDAAKGIREYLDVLDVGRIDIAFREGTFKFLAGPPLYRPLDDEDDDALKPVIGNLSTAHSLYIQGLRTPMQGTLGPYFVDGDKLYAITVRHNLFPLDGANDEYRYTNSKKKKEVILMGDLAFARYESSIRNYIRNLLGSVESLTKQVAAIKKKVEDGVDVDKSKTLLAEKESQLSTTERHIQELKVFSLVVHKKWAERKNRIIGHVVWSPPISTGEDPNNYTCDLCVIELNKKKFKNLLGNFLSLEMKYDKVKLNESIYARDDVPSEFKFPEHGRLGLRRLLSADEVMNPNSKDSLGDPVRRVFKDGYQTNLTIGGLGKFKSTVRKYFPSGYQESTELPVFNHEAEPGTFSKGGDSGSLIVDVLGRFVSLLTGGSNDGTDGTDLTYSTLFEYVWQHVRKEFPNANLNFNHLASCLI